MKEMTRERLEEIRALDVRPLPVGALWNLIDELIEALESHQWRDIDTAPRDGSLIIAGSPEWAWSVPCRWYASGGCWWSDDERFDERVLEPTHWQPLPTPPEVER